VRPGGSTLVSNQPDFTGINHEYRITAHPIYRADSSSSVAVACSGETVDQGTWFARKCEVALEVVPNWCQAWSNKSATTRSLARRVVSPNSFVAHPCASE
jgi:hypothetical protein